MKNHAETPGRGSRSKIDITPESEAEMVVLRNEGNSYFDISVALGLPENRIGKYLKDHPGVTFRQGKGPEPVPAEVIAKMVVLRNEGKTHPEIAAEVDLHKTSVAKHLINHPDVTYKSTSQPN